MTFTRMTSLRQSTRETMYVLNEYYVTPNGPVIKWHGVGPGMPVTHYTNRKELRMLKSETGRKRCDDHRLYAASRAPKLAHWPRLSGPPVKG